MYYLKLLLLWLIKWDSKRAARKHYLQYLRLKTLYFTREQLDKDLENSETDIAFHYSMYQKNLEILNIINENNPYIIG